MLFNLLTEDTFSNLKIARNFTRTYGPNVKKLRKIILVKSI